METNKLLQEMRKAYENDSLDVLTSFDLEKLKGKKIQTIYFGYAGQDGVQEFILGGEKSMYELAAENKDWDGHESQAAYWESIMNPNQIKTYKNTKEVITESGERTRIRRHNGSYAFSCSDEDRYVFYRIVEPNQSDIEDDIVVLSKAYLRETNAINDNLQPFQFSDKRKVYLKVKHFLSACQTISLTDEETSAFKILQDSDSHWIELTPSYLAKFFTK